VGVKKFAVMGLAVSRVIENNILSFFQVRGIAVSIAIPARNRVDWTDLDKLQQ